MIVVADASPLIFLAKIRRLDLIPALLGGDIRVPKAVCKELFVSRMDPAEEGILRSFLDACRIEAVERPSSFASAMSAADNAALTLAVRYKAEFLLCDERITRRMAEAEGIRPMGTLGVLLRAMRNDLLDQIETRRLVDLLVISHGFRIGVGLYQAVLAEIQKG